LAGVTGFGFSMQDGECWENWKNKKEMCLKVFWVQKWRGSVRVKEKC